MRDDVIPSVIDGEVARRPRWAIQGRAAAAGRAAVRSPAAAVVGVLGLMALSVWLRTRALGSSYWIDEGLSVGIASHPLRAIPRLLRQDGSPPLYYLLLHVWTGLAGTREARTHLLSVAFAVATVPVGWLAARSLFGSRAGWIGGALFALDPFLTAYAQETRMYALLALLSLAAAATFAEGFAMRRRRWLPVHAVAVAALLYTHNWAWFFLAACGLALVPCLVAAADRRALARDALLTYGAAALLVAPWLPTLAFQARHTGAPWALHPHPATALHGVYRVLGTAKAAVALLLAGGAGLFVADRAPRERVAIASLGVLAGGTLVIAFLYGQLSLAWATRYLAVLVGPLLLLAAAGLARSGRLGLVGLAVVVASWWGLPSTASLQDKSNLGHVALTLAPDLGRGDLVLSTQPEQVPNLDHYLPAGLRYGTPLGPVPDPRIMDWRDGLDRLRAHDARATLRALLASVPAGRQVLLVAPRTTRLGWTAPWTRLVRRRTLTWSRLLRDDPRLRLVRTLRPRGVSSQSTVRARLYVKVRA